MAIGYRSPGKPAQAPTILHKEAGIGNYYYVHHYHVFLDHYVFSSVNRYKILISYVDGNENTIFMKYVFATPSSYRGQLSSREGRGETRTQAGLDPSSLDL